MNITSRAGVASAVALLIAFAAYGGWISAARGQSRPTRPSPASPATGPAAPAPAPSAAPTNAPPATPAIAAHTHTAADTQRCATCHDALPDGRLRTRLPDRTLKPQGTWLGMGHDRDWLLRHRWVAADNGSLCAKCHQERDCTRCHDGRERPRAIHPNDWLTLHPQQARRSPTECQGCHSLQNVCAECHARLGISQVSAPEVRSGRRVHPPAETWTGAINQHGREASRSLSACVSCHAEQDCVRCHASGASAATRSPHPAGFRGNCTALLDANPRACRLCHGDDLGPLRASCAR